MNTGTTQMMKQLFYISSANGTLLPEVVEEILKVSRRNNRAKGVSGFLLFDGRPLPAAAGRTGKGGGYDDGKNRRG